MQEILEALDRYDEFLILGHEDPDGDCLGSQLALASHLKRRGKGVSLISKGPFRKPGALEWAPRFTQKLPDPRRLDEGSAALILLDCSSPDRTGLDLTLYGDFPLLIIDHHASGSREGNFTYIDAQSPSTTLLIQDLIEAWGDLTAEEADYIFFGFCTDTDYFRHLEGRHRGVFSKLERLMDRGVSPSEYDRRIHSGRTLASKKHLARVLDRTESHLEGRFLFTYEVKDDFKAMEEWERDSAALYKQLVQIEGMRVLCLAKESGEGELSVSFRSVCDIDVGKVAQSFGGGGHPKAAGCLYRGTIDELRRETLALFASKAGSE